MLERSRKNEDGTGIKGKRQEVPKKKNFQLDVTCPQHSRRLSCVLLFWEVWFTMITRSTGNIRPRFEAPCTTHIIQNDICSWCCGEHVAQERQTLSLSDFGVVIWARCSKHVHKTSLPKSRIKQIKKRRKQIWWHGMQVVEARWKLAVSPSSKATDSANQRHSGDFEPIDAVIYTASCGGGVISPTGH